MKEIKEGGFYVGKSKNFDRGIYPNLSRTITTLGDNAVYVGGVMKEIKLKQVAQLNGKGFTETMGRVCDPNGLAPTLNTCGGGNREPKIVAVRGREPSILTPKRTEYGKAVRKQYESGQLAEKRKNMQQLEERKDGLTNTITTVQKDNYVQIPYDEQNKTFRVDGTVGTLTTDGSSPKHNNRVIIERSQKSIMRKLTPRECFRLMGFTDTDFDRVKFYSKKESEEVLKQYPNHKGKRQFTHEQRIERMSDSQCYKQAGNSIVVNVLEAIFKEMIGD